MQDQETAPNSVQDTRRSSRRPDKVGSSRARALIIGVGLAVIGIIVVSLLSRGEEDDAVATKANLRRGLAAHRAGQIEDAVKVYQEVLKSEPGNKYASFNIGVIDQRRGLSASAEKHYKQALASDPNFQPALFNLAVLKEREGANEEAAKLYRRLLELNPNHASGHLNLGFLLVRKMGQEPQGRAELRRAVELDASLARRVPATYLK